MAAPRTVSTPMPRASVPSSGFNPNGTTRSISTPYSGNAAPRSAYAPFTNPIATPIGQPRTGYTPRYGTPPSTNVVPGNSYSTPHTNVQVAGALPTSRSTGGTTQRTLPPAVGGPVNGTGIGSPHGSSVRTIYDRTPGGTAATPVGAVGGGIVGRYAPRADARPMPRGTVGNGAVVGSAVPRASTPPIVGTRFNVPGSGRPTGLTPRTMPNGSFATPASATPRLTAPRLASASTGHVGSFGTAHGLACADPRWNCFRGSCFNSCSGWHNHGCSWGWGGCGWGWGWGIGWGWGWGYPCYGSYWGSCGWPWWGYSSCYPSYWWWPQDCYAPSYLSYGWPSSALVYEHEVPVAIGGEIAVAGSAAGSTVRTEGTPESLAQKYVNLGDFYFKEERFTEAADAYARARTYLPNDASLHFLLADAVFATGDYHFAAFLIGEAVRLDPAMARAETDKRLFYGKPATFEAQLTKLEGYLKDKPYDAMGWLVMGYNQKFAGHADEAKKAFSRVLEIEPENRTAKAFQEALDAPKAEGKDEKPAGERKGG